MLGALGLVTSFSGISFGNLQECYVCIDLACGFLGSVRVEWNRTFFVGFWAFFTNKALTVLYTTYYASFVIVLDICCHVCQNLRFRYIKL